MNSTARPWRPPYGQTYYERSEVRAATLGPATLDLGSIRGPVEVVVDGIPLWLPGEDLAATLLVETKAAPDARGDAGGGLRLRRHDEAATRGSTRGTVDSIKALLVDAALEQASELTADVLATWLDERGRIDGRERPGLWQCSAESLNRIPITTAPRRDERPLLILLHGFASTAAGSFGDFLTEAGRPYYAQLRAHYGERIYAFEHRTLTEDPLDNARALLELLPEGQEVHLLAYSRGGLIAELLALDPSQSLPTGLPPDLADRLRRHLKALGAKKLHVARVVRVASPLAGTGLASDRLDLWLSFLRYGLLLASKANPMLNQSVDLISRFAFAVAAKRLDPNIAPGSAAMNPKAALIAALNAMRAVEQTLTIIAGDVVASGPWSTLKYLILDAFHGVDHDIVVPTASMVRGAYRARTPRYYYAQHAGVHHWAYFHLGDTLRRIVYGLLPEDAADDGFQRLPDGKAMEANRSSARSRPTDPNAPLTVVLPGIMGSTLARGSDRIWVEPVSLCLGQFARLKLSAAEMDTPPAQKGSAAVHAERLFDFFPFDHHGDLADYLRYRGDEVLEFPYDWRRPIARSAEALAAVLRDGWRHGRPLRFVAHSMGGLVVRMLFDRDAELRRRFEADPRCRVLMLGTPNGGSLAVLRALLGQNESLQRLDRIAPGDMRSLLNIAATFVGFLELLPHDRTWTAAELAPLLATGPNPTLDDQALTLAATGRQGLIGALAHLPKRQCHYVAGVADPKGKNPTPVAYEFRDGVVRFIPGPGDGTVSHASGILPDIDTYYTDALHGDLPDHEPAFRDYYALLNGHASAPDQDLGRLKRDPSQVSARGLGRAPGHGRAASPQVGLETGGPASPPPPGLLYRPDASELYYGLFHSAAPAHGLIPVSTRLDVRVVHGDIGLARFPVLVGHYAGQQLDGAERRLDRLYGGTLERNIALGTYPALVGEFAVFGDDDDHRRRRWRTPNAAAAGRYPPPSAVVVGLGIAGELSAGNLSAAVKRGVLAWHGDDAQPQTTRGFAVVLVGINGGGLTIAEVLRAVLSGVLEACEVLRQNGIEPPALLDLYELYRDRAERAAHALLDLAGARDFIGRRIEAHRQLLEHGGLMASSRIYIRPRYLPIDIRWRRQRRCLEYTLSGIQAAAPVLRRQIDPCEVEHYARSREAGRPGLGQILFQQLLPRAVKRHALEQYPLLLMVDRNSAALPWELLTPDQGDAEPWSVGSGMLRQFRDLGYRPLERVAEPTALVIGDPISPLKALPCAQREAEAVAQRLTDCGYRVTLLLRPTADQVRLALGARAYRIVHFAGHGVHDAGDPARGQPVRSGLVIGGVMPNDPQGCDRTECPPGHLYLLSANDLEHSLHGAPEIVFLNCCYVGDFAQPGQEQARGALAAHLARACIGMGVRGVLAAGWAIDDGEAERFACTFYEHLHRPVNLFESVRQARAQIYPGRSNTYGAYQCYGDPYYTVDVADAPPRRAVAAQELADRIRDLAVEVRGLSSREVERIMVRLRALLDQHPAFAHHARVREAEIDARESLGDYRGALAALERWTQADPAIAPAISARLTLRRPFLELRAALRQGPSIKPPATPNFLDYQGGNELLYGGILRRLFLLQNATQDPNRWRTIGRYVQLSADRPPTDQDAATAREWRLKDFVARVWGGWLSARPGAGFYRSPAQMAALDPLRQALYQDLLRNDDPSKFWDDCEVPNLKLILWLDQETRTVPAALSWPFQSTAPVEEILGDYRFAFEQSATPRQRESVSSYAEICLHLLPENADDAVRYGLQRLVDALGTLV